MGWFDPHVCGEENHRFEPRYDSEPANVQFEGRASPQDLRDLVTKRTYVADVRVRCGKTVRRDDVGGLEGR